MPIVHLLALDMQCHVFQYPMYELHRIIKLSCMDLLEIMELRNGAALVNRVPSLRLVPLMPLYVIHCPVRWPLRVHQRS